MNKLINHLIKKSFLKIKKKMIWNPKKKISYNKKVKRQKIFRSKLDNLWKNLIITNLITLIKQIYKNFKKIVKNLSKKLRLLNLNLMIFLVLLIKV